MEIYRGIYVNPHVQRSDLHKSSLPINLQVNPDRSTEIAMEKKTGSPAPAGRRDFCLCKAISVERLEKLGEVPAVRVTSAGPGAE